MGNSILAIGFKQTLLSIFIATALTACGGSSGSSSHASDPEPTPVPTPEATPVPTPDPDPDPTPKPSDSEESGAIKVQVIDGYLNGAKVFADLNRNNYPDKDELFDTTNENGVASLNIPSSKLTDIGSIKIISVSKKGDRNTVLGNPEKLEQDIVMSSTIYLENGKAKPQNFITPFTTLTDLSFSKEESDNPSRDKYSDRLKEIASSIGVDPDVVNSDYNNANNKKNLEALVAGELIVRTNLLPIDPDSFMSVSELKNYTHVIDSLSQYKDVVLDIANNINLNSSKIAEELTENLKEHEAKLDSSFRLLASGPAPDWRCGVTKANNVYCWGNNSWGNLGDPESYPGYDKGNPVEDGEDIEGNFSAKPVAVKIKTDDGYVPLSGVKSVSLGNVHACAVTHVGEVYCWGGNYHGQLGNVPKEMTEDKIKSYHAVKVLRGQQEGSSESEYLSNIDYLQLGNNHSCALSNNGEVFCWGDNSSYELGGDYGEFERKSYDSHDKKIFNLSGDIELNDWIKNVHVPVKLKFPESVAKVKFLSSGLWSHCAIVENVEPNNKHNLYCWGNDVRGTITGSYEQYQGDFNEGGKYYNKHIKQSDIDCTDSIDLPTGACYDVSNNVKWYMYDKYGDMYPLYGAPITKIEYFKGMYEDDRLDAVNVKTVALSDFDALILFEMDGEPDKPSVLYGTWGDSYQEMFGNLKFEKSKLYAAVANAEIPTCVLTDEEKVYCSGSNTYGLLGQGIEVDYSDGDYVEDTNGETLKNVKDLSLVSRSYCASVADQKDEEQLSLYCWGSNAFGQMGFDTGYDKYLSFEYASRESIETTTGSMVKPFYEAFERKQFKAKKITDIFENQ